jgi:PPK2 family polyphosphate:nucleotide phosphotransferase
MFDRYCVKSDGRFKLGRIDPNDLGDLENKKSEGKQRLAELTVQLDKLQEVLYAENKHKILIVIQAMDTAGKDGTIRAVFEGVNPQGVKVASFKTPTTTEQAHDYLWRVHQVVPAKGELVVFNRSHYEDVLIVAVHKWIDAAECKRRFTQIREFEQLLAEEGTTILKFFLHIDAETQRQRLIERIDDPTKQWKFNPGDLDERKLWLNYMKAYENAIKATSTEYAPWYVVPANRNWYRNLIVASVIVDKLKSLNMEYPQPTEDFSPYRQKLDAEDADMD